ncbi:MAG: hypothetical protein K5981_06655 [Clostridia bacterium]|nr:hypothetical protein [Clostridia bacterium]
MTESIRKTHLFDSAEGSVYSIRLTNNTGDYIDLTNYGARLFGVHVHTPGDGMENVAPACEQEEAAIRALSSGCLLGGPLAGELSDKVWDIVDLDQTSIMFTAQTASRIKVGLRVTWVNLNRLILDIFTTPEGDADIALQPRLDLASRVYEIACFCPKVNGGSAADSAYADMAFRSMKCEAEADVFSDGNDAIKPMLEIKDTASSLRISFYSTQHEAKAWTDAGLVSMISFDAQPIRVQASATLTERAIWGFDHITANLASDENDPESPFLGFF